MKPAEVLKVSESLKLVGKPIAYYPAIANVVGSVVATVFLCQFLYWQGKEDKENGGWIYKTMEEIKEETGLSRSEQETARKRLKELGILEEKREGLPARLYYKFNWDRLDELIYQHYITNNNASNGEGVANKFAEIQQTGLLESSKLDCQNSANYIYISENTSENTTENIAVALDDESPPPKWTDNLERVEVELLYKTVDWKRYPHPTREKIKTTIRQMLMDVVCVNRLRRELFPSEEQVAVMIQKDLNAGKLTYEQFAEAYRRWEISGVPKIGWLYKALYGNNEEKKNEEETKQIENELQVLRNQMKTLNSKEAQELYRTKYLPLLNKLLELNKNKKQTVK